MFWQEFKKPIYALAPMAGITDSAFRQVCKDFGADLVYSEMASATALVYAPEKTLEMLKFSKKERPYIVQLFGSDPDYFFKAVKIVEEKIKPDGIDINFGCPVPKVAKQGAGAELMRNLDLAYKVVKSVTKAAKVPVSIKTRSRVGEADILRFLDKISDLPVAAIMIHGRSLAQGHKGEVDFSIIKKVRDFFGGVILANGGVNNRESADLMLAKTNADGVGIAQGALGRPWIFKEIKESVKLEYSPKYIFQIALKHANLAWKLKGEQGIIEMRKHLCWYVRGLPQSRKLREKLVKVKKLEEIKQILYSNK